MPVRLDVWWSAVLKLPKYTALCTLVRAIMTCFHGPQVEGSFNVMGDIINQKSCRIGIETWIVKYSLRARQVSIAEYFQRQDVLHDPARQVSTAEYFQRQDVLHDPARQVSNAEYFQRQDVLHDPARQVSIAEYFQRQDVLHDPVNRTLLRNASYFCTSNDGKKTQTKYVYHNIKSNHISVPPSTKGKLKLAFQALSDAFAKKLK